MNIKDIIFKKFDLGQQIVAFKNLPEFFLLIWRCNSFLTTMNIFLRIIRAGIPITMLYVGKLIIDEIVIISEKNNGAEIEISELSILLEVSMLVMDDLQC